MKEYRPDCEGGHHTFCSMISSPSCIKISSSLGSSSWGTAFLWFVSNSSLYSFALSQGPYYLYNLQIPILWYVYNVSYFPRHGEQVGLWGAIWLSLLSSLNIPSTHRKKLWTSILTLSNVWLAWLTVLAKEGF